MKKTILASVFAYGLFVGVSSAHAAYSDMPIPTNGPEVPMAYDMPLPGTDPRVPMAHDMPLPGNDPRVPMALPTVGKSKAIRVSRLHF